jgi:hypothetical protein
MGEEHTEVGVIGLNKIFRFIIADTELLNTITKRCMDAFKGPPRPLDDEHVGWSLTPTDMIKISSSGPGNQPAGAIIISIFRTDPNELDEILEQLVELLIPECSTWLRKKEEPGKGDGKYRREGNLSFFPGCEPEDNDNLEV